jgi:glyoxylase-like metal-dependent hydrolase (beta-lactamase superfamily II)
LALPAVFVNTYAVRTSAGLLLIDPGLADRAPQVHAAIRAWAAAPVHTVICTHGHADHAFGLAPFLAAGERPAIVAQGIFRAAEENAERSLGATCGGCRVRRVLRADTLGVPADEIRTAWENDEDGISERPWISELLAVSTDELNTAKLQGTAAAQRAFTLATGRPWG